MSSARFPFPIPSGWFRVAFEDEIEPGSVRALRYFGRDLVLVCPEQGEPRVFDAYCPHLGAHLGFGGTVEGESLRCPFHGWRFDMQGPCIEVPYARRVPAQAALRGWPTRVRFETKPADTLPANRARPAVAQRLQGRTEPAIAPLCRSPRRSLAVHGSVRANRAPDPGRDRADRSGAL